MSKRSSDSEDVSIRKRKQSIIPKSSNAVGDDGLSQCFQKVTTQMYVSLAPKHLHNPINGLKAQHLDPMIMTYFPKARGVVLAYSNITLSDDNITTDSDNNVITIAKIEGSSPFTFLWITVDLLIWRPLAGDVLEGYIYMQTASHLGLLIHDTFNASIKKYNIPNDWRFVPNQEDELNDDSTNFKSFGYWVDENDTKVEGKLRFTIKSMQTSGKVVSAEGTLIKPGAEKDSQPISRERRSSTSSQAKSKHMKFDDDIPSVVEIEEPTEDTLPAYVNDSDEPEDGAIVNNSDSEDSD